MYRSLATLALLASPALAFVGTSPLVAWSSSSASLDSLKANGPVVDARTALDTVFGGQDVCQSKVLVISQEDLHSEDLASFPLLAPHLASASLQIPYATSSSVSTVDAALAELLAACSGSSVQTKEAGEDLASLWTEGGFEVVKVVAPKEQQSGESRSDQLRWEDALITPQIKHLLDASSPHVVVLTGHPSAETLLQVQRRQSAAERPLSSPQTASSKQAFAPSSNRTTDDLPLLARYQFISTPVLMMTLVSLFVLLPILGLGISALASIQVPPRMDNVKGIQVGVTLDKKNQ